MIDKAALKSGMPMGPIELVDTVGLDMCKSVTTILSVNKTLWLPTKKLLIWGTKEILVKKSAKAFYKWSKVRAIKRQNISILVTTLLRGNTDLS